MHIETDLKLDFRDVLIRPKRSVLTSRSEANITRSFRFHHSKAEWTGFPLIASNMDTIGTFEMARALGETNALVALHKYYPAKELVAFFRGDASRSAFFTIGTSPDDWEKLAKVKEQVSIPMINIDVANGYVCSDGGCSVPGDIVKAIGGGADFVMLGGMLAGHAECGGEIQYEGEGDKRKPTSMLFYGMSSETAMHKHHGGVAEYRAAEGKTVLVPYKGQVKDTLSQIAGGIRSAMTYIGAENLKEVTKRTTFILVNAQRNTVFG